MRRLTNDSRPLAARSTEKAARAAKPLQNAGAYLKALRRTRKLSQSELAEAIEVGRGSIERLEGGDARIRIGTVLRVLTMLDASAWDYFELALYPWRTLGEVRQQRMLVQGIEAYIRGLAERKQVSPTVLAEIMHTQPPDAANGDDRAAGQFTPELSLLRALIYLDAPLADVAEILRGSSDHEAIGRRLAEERTAFAMRLQEAHQREQAELRAVPSLNVVMRRMRTIVQNSPELSAMLKHELSRLIADLERYRAYVANAVDSLLVEP
jgi:transcriptional regulator with XRE-family HTH domain